jgi:hypothetical protein
MLVISKAFLSVIPLFSSISPPALLKRMSSGSSLRLVLWFHRMMLWEMRASNLLWDSKKPRWMSNLGSISTCRMAVWTTILPSLEWRRKAMKLSISALDGSSICSSNRINHFFDHRHFNNIHS